MDINPVVEDVTTAVTTTSVTTAPVVSTTNTIVIAHEVATDTNSTIHIDTNSKTCNITHNIRMTFKVPRPTNLESWTIVSSSRSLTKGRNLELNDPTPPHLQLRGKYPLLMKSDFDTDSNLMRFQDMLHRTTTLLTL